MVGSGGVRTLPEWEENRFWVSEFAQVVTRVRCRVICPANQDWFGYFFVEMENGTQEREQRIALIGIIVEDLEATGRLNTILHEYNGIVIGRMGIPYRKEGIAVISVAVDADNATISALSGKLGMIPGINVKTLYARTR